jgi:hypothetical protein
MNTKLIVNLVTSSSTVTSFISTLGQINPFYTSISFHTSINLTQRSIHTNEGRTYITNPHDLNDFVCIRVCIRDSERDPKAAPA